MRLQQDIYQTFPQEQPNPYMPPDQFVAYVAWPKDRFYYSGKADPANEEEPSTAGVDDDFNIELNEFLGRED